MVVRSTLIYNSIHSDWIPSHLQLETQAALRVEMEKPRSKSDVYGYIYCYEIRGESCIYIYLLRLWTKQAAKMIIRRLSNSRLVEP